MRALNAADLLRVWEVGQTQHPLERSLTLLAAVRPELSGEEMVALPVGERDAVLFDLREQMFGPQLEAYVECSQCGERLEFVLDTSALRGQTQAEPAGREHVLVEGGYEVRFRAPDSRDLAAAVAESEVTAARDLLLRRCILAASKAGRPRAVRALPRWLVAQVVARLAEVDPRADVLLDMTCPTCGGTWQALLDIGAFVWIELAAQARRLLGEVHSLARAYGWCEPDILAMTARRRQAYLEMVGA